MDYAQDVVNKSNRALGMIPQMEIQVTKLETKLGADRCRSLKNCLEKAKGFENLVQMTLGDPSSMTSAMAHNSLSQLLITSRRQHFESCEMLIDNYQKECDEKIRIQKTQDDVARLQKAMNEKDVEILNLQRLLKESKVQMKADLQKALEENTQAKDGIQQDLQKSNNEVVRLQKALDEKEAECQRRLTDFDEEKAQMKKVHQKDIQMSKDDVARLQKDLDEKYDEILKLQNLLEDFEVQIGKDHVKHKDDFAYVQNCYDEKYSEEVLRFRYDLKEKEAEYQRLLEDSDKVHQKELQKSNDEVSRLQKALEDRDMDNENLQRLLKDSEHKNVVMESMFQKLLDKKDQKYVELAMTKNDVARAENSGFQKDSEIKELCEQLGKLYVENQRLKAEQPCQNEIQMESKPEQLSQNVLVNPEQSASHETEQPIIHIPRSLPEADKRTPKDFQINNLIHANRQLSVQQSDYHKTHEDDDIDVMTEDEQSATVTQKIEALKTENKELKTKLEMINL